MFDLLICVECRALHYVIGEQCCYFLCTFAWIDYLHCISEVLRIVQKLHEAAPLRGYLHCFRLVLGVQKLYEAVITSLSFHNPFEIALMKRVRYFVEVLARCSIFCRSFRSMSSTVDI